MQDTRKLHGVKAVAFRNRYPWLKPDLGILSTTSNMNMSRLAREAFVREKEISQGAITKDDRHLAFTGYYSAAC